MGEALSCQTDVFRIKLDSQKASLKSSRNHSSGSCSEKRIAHDSLFRTSCQHWDFNQLFRIRCKMLAAETAHCDAPDTTLVSATWIEPVSADALQDLEW